MAEKWQRKGRVRLMIDFKDEKALVEFAQLLKEHGFLPEHAGVFRPDALDFLTDSGVTKGRSYLVRNINERGHGRVV